MGQGQLPAVVTKLVDMAALVCLRLLDLRGCTAIEALPASIQQLGRLVYLNMDGCRLLQALPEGFGGLFRLQRLILTHCTGLKKLPHSFGRLSSLEGLNLAWCGSLEQLPDSFGQLRKLNTLDLRHCGKLSSLSHGFGSLSSLQRLSIGPGPYCLPASLGYLTSLQQLDHRRSTYSFRLRPSSPLFGHDWAKLTKLQFLSLEPSSCYEVGLRGIGQLRLLQRLDLRSCSESVLPPYFGNLTALSWLELSDSCLRELPASFGQLRSLQYLGLASCTALQSLPNSFCDLTSLQDLMLMGCTGLRQLPDKFGELTALQRVVFRDCSNLLRLPDSCWLLPMTTKIEGAYFARTICTVGSLTLAMVSQACAWPPPPCSWGRMASCEDVRKLQQEVGVLLSSCYLGVSEAVQLADGYCQRNWPRSDLFRTVWSDQASECVVTVLPPGRTGGFEFAYKLFIRCFET